MNLVRLALSAVSVLLLMLGYIGSQHAYLNGRASYWAATMDQPAVRAIAGLMLLAALILTLIPKREEAPE